VATLFPRHDERKADSAARPPREHRSKASSQRIAAITALGAPWLRFDRGEQIGEGGMAKIHRAADTLLRRNVAVKTVRGNLAADFDDELLARALDEAQIAAQLDHPSILAPHEITLDDEGKLTIVMPIAPGGSLADHLRSATPAHWRANTALLLSTCRGLAFAHGKGVVHRDVKPGNILLGDHGDAYLTDWGLALLHRLESTSESRIRLTRGGRFDPAGDAEETLSDEDPVTRHGGRVVGTPLYMSPEQCQFDPTAVGPPSDVFSAGVVLYEILTGEHPFAWPGTSRLNFLEQRTTQQASPVRSRCPRTPRAVADVCDRALRLHPLDRYGNAGEFAAALEAALH
jgi:serine/threonine-protein kinase